MISIMKFYMQTRVMKTAFKLFRCKALTPLWLSLALAMVVSVQSKGQADSLFGLANKQYQQNEFTLAAATYCRLIEKGIKTPEIFYNLGNAYYKSGRLGYAILYYEKAKLLAPHDNDIARNLAIANARVLDKIDVIPDFFIRRWFYQLVNLLSSNTWAVIALATFASMLTAWLLYLFSGRIAVKRLAFYSATGLLLISMLSYWFSVKRKQYVADSSAAIVVKPSVSIKSSPDFEGNNIFVLHEGTRVMVTDSIDSWKEIKLTDGNKGWLESETIEPV